MNSNDEDFRQSGQGETSRDERKDGSAGASASHGHMQPQVDMESYVHSAFADSRKHPTHGVYFSPVQPTIVYLTVCCKERKPWLATDSHHELLLSVWHDTSHWVVGQYVLMPDHLHLMAAPQENAVAFDAWVKYFKSQFTKRNKNRNCVWQADHWDTRIRSAELYEEKSIYMHNNPVRARLVADAVDWKFRGVVHDLRWE
jgi:REP element-mobilizing transposase RayT